MSLKARVNKLEQLSPDVASRPRLLLVSLRDGETESQGIEREKAAQGVEDCAVLFSIIKPAISR